MLAELYVPAFRTLICVPRLRGPEGVVVVADFFFNATLQKGVSGVLFLLVYTASRASDKRRIQIIHKPNLFHTSRFCKLSGKLLNSDRERYFFHVYERCRSYAEGECGRKKKKITPPVPQFEATVVSCLCQISLLSTRCYFTKPVLSVLEVTTGANCCGFLTTRGSLFK